jgi:5'-nucleotidase / UDP-sugar diphosphatase
MLHCTKWIAIGCVAALVGCQSADTAKPTESAAVRSDVTDIHPTEPAQPVAYQPAPATYQPAVAQPVSYDPTAAATANPATASGNTHVVKHGETLYSIAKASYGDGKQWTRIASANPGVSPTSLKVGQTIVVP